MAPDSCLRRNDEEFYSNLDPRVKPEDDGGGERTPPRGPPEGFFSGMGGTNGTCRLTIARGQCIFGKQFATEAEMKTKSSLKSAKKRSKNVQLIRRGKTVFAIDKKNPRFNAKQG
jgi:large subunit ribosomal protein L36